MIKKIARIVALCMIMQTISLSALSPRRYYAEIALAGTAGAGVVALGTALLLQHKLFDGEQSFINRIKGLAAKEKVKIIAAFLAIPAVFAGLTALVRYGQTPWGVISTARKSIEGSIKGRQRTTQSPLISAKEKHTRLDQIKTDLESQLRPLQIAEEEGNEKTIDECRDMATAVRAEIANLEQAAIPFREEDVRTTLNAIKQKSVYLDNDPTIILGGKNTTDFNNDSKQITDDLDYIREQLKLAKSEKNSDLFIDFTHTNETILKNINAVQESNDYKTKSAQEQKELQEQIKRRESEAKMIQAQANEKRADSEQKNAETRSREENRKRVETALKTGFQLVDLVKSDKKK